MILSFQPWDYDHARPCGTTFRVLAISVRNPGCAAARRPWAVECNRASGWQCGDPTFSHLERLGDMCYNGNMGSGAAITPEVAGAPSWNTETRTIECRRAGYAVG